MGGEGSRLPDPQAVRDVAYQNEKFLFSNLANLANIYVGLHKAQQNIAPEDENAQLID
jgi:hypothetical protein